MIRTGAPTLRAWASSREANSVVRRLRSRWSSGPLSSSWSTHGPGGGEGERMADERAGEERDADLGDRVVAVLPRASVERVHVLAPTGDQADREPAADDLAVGGHVGADAEDRLGAAGVGAEPGDDLVEDERRARGLGQAADLLEELAGLEIGTAALDRLDEDGGELGAVRLQVLERDSGSRSRGRRRSRTCSSGMPGAMGIARSPAGRTRTSSKIPW